MTRKHYVAFANALGLAHKRTQGFDGPGISEDDALLIASFISQVFQSDNSNFRQPQFMEAVLYACRTHGNDPVRVGQTKFDIPETDPFMVGFKKALNDA